LPNLPNPLARRHIRNAAGSCTDPDLLKKRLKTGYVTAVDAAIKNNDTAIKSVFPAISITLEEIRRLYDLEEGRRQSLENKAGILIGAIGVILTIVTVFDQKSIEKMVLFHILLIIALLFGLLVVKPSEYKIPHKKYCEFYGYARKNEEKVMDIFLLNYIKVLEDMENKNNTKVKYLEIKEKQSIICPFAVGFS